MEMTTIVNQKVYDGSQFYCDTYLYTANYNQYCKTALAK